MKSHESSHQKPKDMLGRKGLCTVADAQNILLKNLQGAALPEVKVLLTEALDRVLSQDIYSTEDLPQHPRSTMDGFAVNSQDTFGSTESMPCYLEITGEILMGEYPDGKVTRGGCFRIATGGLVPEGADAVVMFEHTVPVDQSMVEIVKSVGPGSNIVKTGDDIATGELALSAGRLIRPQDLGLLAGLGNTEVSVFSKVTVGILSTGDEIIPYSASPEPGKIRNINSITISSQAKRLGAEIRDYGIVPDNEEHFFPAIEKAVHENDIVLFSGGSSVGSRDLGEKAIAMIGNPGILIHGVALKPGKPILIGLHGNKPLFGLPGHPVSAMTCFDLFVAPAIKKIAGWSGSPFSESPYIEATLAKNIPSAAGRKDIARVALHEESNQLFATPVFGKSGSISTLSRSQGYIIVEESLQGLAQNSTVKVYLYT